MPRTGPTDSPSCVRENVHLGSERTAVQDVSFGLRQLTDVAVKALSPGINDPTTAVHALNHSAALLCDLARRQDQLGPRVLRDDAGRPRVVLARPDLATLLELAVQQPRRYGAADPQVLACLLSLLREVAWAMPAAQRRLVTGQLARARATIEQQDFDAVERARLAELAGRVEAATQGRWERSAGGDGA